MKFEVAACTDIGRRKDLNQDSYWVWRIRKNESEMIFAILCDGMGGLDAGEAASGFVVRAFREWVQSDFLRQISFLNMDSDQSFWRSWVQKTHSRLQTWADRNEKRTGTTMTALVMNETKIQVCHAGDTRLYCVAGKVRKMTEDHTLAEWRRKSGLDPADADHILMQGIGAFSGADPDFFQADRQHGACYLLCSDGFYHSATENELKRLFAFSRRKNRQRLAKACFRQMEKNLHRGETDNMTVIVIGVSETDL